MFQDMYSDLPVMSTEVLALRRQLWDAEGYHLIYNVPRFAAGVVEAGPVRPFAGLCIAYLVLLRKDKQQFCPQVGDRPRCYQIGWGDYSSGFGLFSITLESTDSWVGYKDTTHPGLNAGYYYCFFYFETYNTLHGFINNMDLRDDTAHPYDVSEASDNILFGQTYWHEVETVEVHWVLWGSPHNSGSQPSPSLMDQLFVKYQYGEYHYQFQNILQVRGGAVITASVMYEANTAPDRRVNGDVGVYFGLGEYGGTQYEYTYFQSLKDPSTIYVFRINVTHTGAIVYHKSMSQILYTNDMGSNEEVSLYFVMINVKPLRLFIETMGYRWH